MLFTVSSTHTLGSLMNIFALIALMKSAARTLASLFDEPAEPLKYDLDDHAAHLACKEHPFN